MKLHYYQSKNEDSRGLFLCLLTDRLKLYSELNYAKSVKDSIRGNHYHKNSNEMFFVIKGKIKLVIQKIECGKIINEEEYYFSEYDMFEVEPYENHTIYILEDSEWISLLTTKFNLEMPDFHKI